MIWTLCKDKLPTPSDETLYLVTVLARTDNSVTTMVGRYMPASAYPSDTEPRDAWMTLIDAPMGEETELGNHSEWEPPMFWNSVVIAWAEMPAPWTGA